MPRWYQGFECYGKPSNVVDTIRNIVRWNDLGNTVPVVRVEKEAKRGRFLLFLAIENSIRGEVPEGVRATVFHLPALRTPIPKPFDYEEISSAVGAELDVHNYAHSIPYPYKRFEARIVENPFDIAETMMDSSSDVDDLLIGTQRYDRLMLWISAVGSGSWEAFRSACQTLQLDNDGSKSRSILRRLRLLGHLESSYDGSYWSIAPSILVSFSDGRYFLCGQRDVAMLQALHKVANVQEYPQNGNAPAVIRVSVSKTAQVIALSETSADHQKLRILENVAYRLAHFLPSLNDWMNTLGQLEGLLPHMFTLKKYDGTSFVNTTFQEQIGFYEWWPLERTAITSRPLYTLFYDAVSQRWLRGDWYGLRFLSLQSSGDPCPVHYETSTGRLAIPQRWRWPELYERALVLASGQLPAEHNSWLIYEAIQPNLLDCLSTKLNLKREETPLHA